MFPLIIVKDSWIPSASGRLGYFFDPAGWQQLYVPEGVATVHLYLCGAGGNGGGGGTGDPKSARWLQLDMADYKGLTLEVAVASNGPQDPDTSINGTGSGDGGVPSGVGGTGTGGAASALRLLDTTILAVAAGAGGNGTVNPVAPAAATSTMSSISMTNGGNGDGSVNIDAGGGGGAPGGVGENDSTPAQGGSSVYRSDLITLLDDNTADEGTIFTDLTRKWTAFLGAFGMGTNFNGARSAGGVALLVWTVA